MRKMFAALFSAILCVNCSFTAARAAGRPAEGEEVETLPDGTKIYYSKQHMDGDIDVSEDCQFI